MKLIRMLLPLLLPLAAMAQEEETWKEASPESQAYHAYRLKTSVPPYGLAKVKALIAKLDADEEGNSVPGAKAYQTLSLREQFTYHMIHAESYSQNCDVAPPIQDEHKKISAFLPEAFDEAEWSDRQLAFLKDNRDSVMAIIQESANRSKRLGLNYKHAIVEMGAVEMVPFLAEFYNRDHKDLDILTVLLLLMKKVQYPPFMSSTSAGKLYGANADYDAFLQYNKANEALIIKRAMDLYNSAG